MQTLCSLVLCSASSAQRLCSVHYSQYCPLQPVCKQTKSHSEPTLRQTPLVELAIIQPRTFSPEDFPNRSKSVALKKKRKLITLQIHYIWAQNILLGDFKFFSRHLVMVNPIPCSTTCPPCFISKTRHLFPSVSDVILILSSDTICQLNRILSNSGAAGLSIKQNV